MTATATNIRPANRSIIWESAGVEELERALGVILAGLELPLSIARNRGFYLSDHRFMGWRDSESTTLAELAVEIQAWLDGLDHDLRVQLAGGSPPDRAAVLHSGFRASSELKWDGTRFERYYCVKPAWV